MNQPEKIIKDIVFMLLIFLVSPFDDVTDGTLLYLMAGMSGIFL
jgi:hypothetical protein